MYFVIFNDEVQGMSNESFETFEEAAEYWQQYADTPTCVGGVLFDAEASETIWSF